MVTSIDGKVTGEFLSRPECEKATEIYYNINRDLKSNGFICGRVTMESSFTNGWYPDLAEYAPVKLGSKTDFIPKELSGFYAVAFDTNGKLGLISNRIVDDDPGYGGAQIIEVLSENTDERFLGYLKSKNIPYIFAGKDKIDVKLALFKLKSVIGAETLLLEGGSIINGAFQNADVIDELSIVVAPVVADANDKPLFGNSVLSDFVLVRSESQNGVLVLNYKRK
jgi:riboflavin biosynthesis pyrimidine reductase